MRQLSLDNTYRKHYQLFHLNNGTVIDSREKNWREVEWEKLDKLEIIMKGHQYEITKEGKDNFKGFVTFRSAGFINKTVNYKTGKVIEPGKRIHTWTIGWTDGIKCFLKEINFFTKKLINEYECRLDEAMGHIHPRLNLGG